MRDGSDRAIASSKGPQSPLRVALLTNIPAPYRLGFFHELNELCDLTVIFDSVSEANRRWPLRAEELRFPYRYLRGLSIPYTRKRNVSDQRFLQLRYDILFQLFRLRPEIIVSAEMGPRSLQAAFFCQTTQTPLIIWWEGTRHTEGTVSLLKAELRRYLVRQSTRLWSNGRESSALLAQYGARPDQIDMGMTGTDTMTLASSIEHLSPQREKIRAEFGLSGTVLLYLGQLTVRKGIPQYLAALNCEPLEERNCSLLFVGSGELEGELRQWAAGHPKVPVVLAGFVEPAMLPRYLCAADIFILPTLDDNWALASLEALTARLPQLFSVYNGATADLMQLGLTGRIIDPRKTEDLAVVLAEWLAAPPPRLPADDAAPIVHYFSSQQMAGRAIASLKTAIKTGISEG
jgi:glycosyltransferase involved in cell wall biosynthesis